MQDMVDDIVQQIAFMADHHHHRRIAFEEIFQPQGRFQIQVVRRFIKQQQIRLRKQQRRQRHAHFPTTREAVERLPLIFLVKAKADQYPRSPRRRGVGVNRDQAFMHFGHAVGVKPLLLAFGHQRRALGIRRQHRVKRRRIARRCLLRDIADARALGHLQRPVIGLQRANHHLHQRRFTRTIAPDQADTPIRRQSRRGAVKDSASAKAHGDTVQIKHAAARSRPSAPCQSENWGLCAANADEGHPRRPSAGWGLSRLSFDAWSS